MTRSEMYDRNLEMIKAAADHKQVDHIPLLSMAQTWAIAYYGTTAEDALSSAEREYEVYAKHLLDMPFDGTLFFGMNRPLKIYDSLGFSSCCISSDGVTLQAKDVSLIGDDDLDDYIEDPAKALLGMLYRRYPAFHGSIEDAVAALLQSVQAFSQFGAKSAGVNEYLRKNVGVPFCIAGGINLAYEKYAFTRGFGTALTDLRRRPEKTLDAIEATYKLVAPVPGAPETYPWLMNPVTTPTYLNRKSFEKFFWPTAKRAYDILFANGQRSCLFMEGKWAHVYDHLLDYPKGSFVTFVESDDFIQAKKDLGDKFVLIGGMSQPLMREGSVEDNIVHVRNIMEQCGPSGYMFAPTHGLLSANDVKAENMKAICEFVQGYRF